VTFSDAVKTCFSKYLTFSGRASRAEYWYFFAFVVLATLIAGTIDRLLLAALAGDGPAVSGQPIQAIVGLVLLLPHFAAAWRRMHDTGRSGYYVLTPTLVSVAAMLVAAFGLGLADMATGTLDSLLTSATLIVLIPLLIIGLISPLLVLWWLTRPSQTGPNTYGPNPHEVTP